MSALAGLSFAIRVADEVNPQTMLPIEGIRVTKLTVANELVDITAAGGDGWRHLLSGAGIRSVSLNGEGLFMGSLGEQRLRRLALTGTAELMNLRLEDSTCLTARFVVSALTMRGQHDEPVTFEITLESAGEVQVA